MAQRSSAALLASLPSKLQRRTAGGRIRPVLARRSAHVLAMEAEPEENTDALPCSFQPEAGPSRLHGHIQHHPVRRRNLQSALDQLGESDRSAVAKINELVNLPSDHRLQKTLDAQLWWNYNLLSPSGKSVLSTQTLRRVLRKVVSGERARDHRKTASADETASTKAQASRALAVLHDMKLAAERERAAGQTPSLGTEEYHFVLAKFAAIGRVSKVERIVADMKEMGIPLKIRTQELRLQAFSRWINHQSLEYDKRKTGMSFVRGERYSKFKEKEPYIPPAHADTISRVVEDLHRESQGALRSRALDLVLRLAKDSGSEEAYHSVLSQGFGLDLREIGLQSPLRSVFADSSNRKTDNFAQDLDGILQRTKSQIPWAGTPPMVNTHTLNTILSDLAVKGDFVRMTTVYEILASPATPALSRESAIIDGFKQTRSSSANPAAQYLQPPPRLSKHAQVDDEDVPHTLTEAIKAEAQRGDTLGFFGQRKGGASGPILPPLPDRPYVPYSKFVSPAPSVFTVEAGVRRLDDLSPILQNIEHRIWGPANVTSFKLLIRGCINAAWRADERTEPAQAELAALMALHHLRCAAREDAARRNVFLLRWVAVREEAQRRLAALASRGLGQSDSKALILDWRAEMRSRLQHPATLLSDVDFNMILALRRHCQALKRLRPMLRLKIGVELSAVLGDLKKEYLVLTGHAWRDREEDRKRKDLSVNGVSSSARPSPAASGPSPAASGSAPPSGKPPSDFFKIRPHNSLTMPVDVQPLRPRFDLTSHIHILSQNIKSLTVLADRERGTLLGADIWRVRLKRPARSSSDERALANMLR